MAPSTVHEIKHAQKERLLLKAISNLFLRITFDDPELQGLTISKVSLSADKRICTAYFFTPEGEAVFEKKLNYLIPYKTSMRKALAHAINFRYAPELIFRFDKQFERTEKVNAIIDELIQEDKI